MDATTPAADAEDAADSNEIAFDVTDPAMAAYQKLQPGEEGECKHIKFTVTENDGKVLRGEISELEPGDSYAGDTGAPDEGAAEMPPGKAVKPLAVIAIGVKPKA